MKDLQSRLKQLGAPYYGDKSALWNRLQEYEPELAYQSEHNAAAAERREAEGEQHPAGVLVAPKPPSPDERALYELTHTPVIPWCEQCVRGRAVVNPHRAILPQGREKGISVIATDFAYLKADCAISENV